LESETSIKSFANKVNNLPRLDVLINNAGISPMKFELVYGTEKTVAVNVIGTFLLSFLLLPKLRETATRYDSTPHMTFVGSALHSVANWPPGCKDDIFEYLSDEKNVNMMDQFVSLSKSLKTPR
jgi:retinol dehydrogenase-12